MKLTQRCTTPHYEKYYDLADSICLPNAYRYRATSAEKVERAFLADAVAALSHETSPEIVWHEGYYCVVSRWSPTHDTWSLSFPRPAGVPVPPGGTSTHCATRKEAAAEALQMMRAGWGAI